VSPHVHTMWEVPMPKPFPPTPRDVVNVFHPERDTSYVHFERGDQHPFQPDPPGGFLRVNAWWLADAALLSYWPPAQALRIFRGAGFECEPDDGTTATNYYLAWRPGCLLVAFRGTQPDQWQDSLDDINVGPPVALDGRQVHRGFYEALDRVWPKLTSRLGDLATGRTVWFCGHSLGAAIATLAAYRYDRTRGVCTFGSPRVGDAQFAATFNQRFAGRSWRFVNDHDVVTHVPPPRFLGMRFEHVDAARFIAPDGTVSATAPAVQHYVADIFGESLASLRGIVTGLRDGRLGPPPDALLDHMPKEYAVASWNDYEKNG
jgi:triacylglycerol lipase